jgi:capsule polysaccharide export protein KpsE/RkpR
LDELYLAQKERILNLEKKLLASTLQVQEQRGKFEQLEADFQHNLGVIAARDEELAAMGNKLLQLKQLCQDKQAQVKRLEERGVSVKEEARTTKDELLERLDSVR